MGSIHNEANTETEKKILTSNPSNEIIYVLLEEMVHKYTNLTKEVEDMKKYLLDYHLFQI